MDLMKITVIRILTVCFHSNVHFPKLRFIYDKKIRYSFAFSLNSIYVLT